MKVIISTDLEGVSCVDSIDMMDRQNESNQFACRMLMNDLNAAIRGAIDGGADQVVVLDGHAGGGNFIPLMLDPRARWEKAVDFHDVDALLCVGAHAMAGTVKAFLDHTQNSREIFDYTVGGKSYGELGQQAILAGAYGVPLVMVSGDEAACEETKTLSPDAALAVVKTAEIRNRATCLPQEEALQRIYEAAKDGVRRCKEITPYNAVTLPTEVSVTYYRNDFCDRTYRPGLRRKGRTLTKTIDKIDCFDDLNRF